jgi:tetratricopeptide (TPR) repeat protein
MAATSRPGRRPGVCLALAVLALPALAAGIDDDWRRCIATAGEDGDLACLRLAAQEEVRAADLLRLADELIAAKAYGRAVRLLAEAVRRQPQQAALADRLRLARSYADEEAWVARRQGGAAAPRNDEVGVSLARIRCTRLSGAEALAACDEALRSLPDDADLLAARGDLLAAAGNIAEASAAYARALGSKPDNPLLRQKLALLGGGAPPRPVVQAPEAGGDLDQRLATLQRLRERKLINEAEYAKRKAALLDTAIGGSRAGDAVAAKAPAAPRPVPAIDFGRYHALVVGIDGYKHLPKLETARNDARAIAAILRDHYDFKVRLLTDASREQIMEALDEYRERLGANDNLLIYYAGHGWLDKEADQGFWLPVDARAERRSQWLSNDTVRDAAKAMKAKHLLVVADSCFSGTLTRSFVVPPIRDEDYLKRMAGKKARLAIASGGLEPVADSTGGGHSPFAQTLVNILKDNQGVMDGTTLFGELRRPVAVNADQTPEFADIRRAGHDGGDFLFVRRR